MYIFLQNYLHNITLYYNTYFPKCKCNSANFIILPRILFSFSSSVLPKNDFCGIITSNTSTFCEEIMTNDIKKARPVTAPLIAMATVLIILHAAALAVSMRYAYISTDILALTEAKLLVNISSVISPLIDYVRLGFLVCGYFAFPKKSALLFFICAALSLLCGAGCDLFLSARYDTFFTGNEALYFIATSLSLAVSLAALLIIAYYTRKRRNNFESGKGKKHPLGRSFLFAALVTFIIDTVYRTYTLLGMVFSDGGVSFQSLDDYLYLAYDYLYPLVEAALGFGFMCLLGRLFFRRSKKSS